MAVDNLQFGAIVGKWVSSSEARLLAVFRESTQRVVSEAQRMIPVDTGFARASVQASLQETPEANRPRPAGASMVAYEPTQLLSVIISAQLGDTIHVGWTANYALALEYGHSKQAPSGFVRIAAMQWKKIVSQVVGELRSRSGMK